MLPTAGSDSRINAIARTRKIAASTLAQSVRESQTSASELSICDSWSKLLAAEGCLLEQGWYQPPPNGTSVLIGNPPDFNRLRFQSLRDPQTWPRADVALNSESLLYAYTSPVDAETKMIGDLSVTLYNGTDEKIWQHLSACIEITAKVADFAQVGMELRELYQYAATLMDEKGLRNQTFSTTDPSGIDIGHTLPWSYEAPPSDEQISALATGDIAKLATTISRARRFLNDQERQCILPTMAFTVEPRMSAPNLPVTNFHVLVVFDNGVKQIYSEFSELFDLFDMKRRLPHKALETLRCA